jgi:hypothetical protein
MRYKDFKEKMIHICEKKQQKPPKTTDLMYIWRRYIHVCGLIESISMANDMIKFIDMSSNERLKYRNKLANEGVELTPYQVQLYIYMMHIAADEWLRN